MKRVRPVGWFIVLIATGVQPALIPAQEANPAVYLMADVLVDVSQAAEYEAAFKELLGGFKKHAFPFVCDTYSTDDSHYFTIFSLKNYGDVDRWLAAFTELGEKMGPDHLRTLEARVASCAIERSYAFWYFRPDISYLPPKERLKPEDIGYYTWDFVWIIPGKEAEFEAVNREWIALSAAKKSPDPFMTYQGGLGTKMPVYVWFEYGRSAADYAAAEEKFWRTMGKEGAALSRKTRALIRKMETKTGRYRPDLSYSPEGTPR